MDGVIQSPMWAPGINTSLPLANGLTAYWPTWEGDGNTITDVVSGRRSVMTNMDGTNWERGNSGYSLRYNGSNETINLGLQTLAFPNGGTMFAWINHDNPTDGTDDLFFARNESGNIAGDLSFYKSSGNVWGFVQQDGALSRTLLDPNTATVGWHLLCATWEQAGGSVKLWVDGKVVDTDTAVNITGSATEPFRLGSFKGSSLYWDGLIGDVGIYTRPLATSEVQQLYAEPDILTRYRSLA